MAFVARVESGSQHTAGDAALTLPAPGGKGSVEIAVRREGRPGWLGPHGWQVREKWYGLGVGDETATSITSPQLPDPLRALAVGRYDLVVRRGEQSLQGTLIIVPADMTLLEAVDDPPPAPVPTSPRAAAPIEALPAEALTAIDPDAPAREPWARVTPTPWLRPLAMSALVLLLGVVTVVTVRRRPAPGSPAAEAPVTTPEEANAAPARPVPVTAPPSVPSPRTAEPIPPPSIMQARALVEQQVAAARAVAIAHAWLDAGARGEAVLLLDYATEAGQADAAFLAAQLHDPTRRGQSPAPFDPPNVAKALALYERAVTLGHGEAAGRLASLRAYLARPPS